MYIHLLKVHPLPIIQRPTALVHADADEEVSFTKECLPKKETKMAGCQQSSGNSQGCQRQRTIGQKPARCSIPRGKKIQAALLQKE